MTAWTIGEDALGVELTRISRSGVWLLYNGRELFMPYGDFPWFEDKPVGAVINVREIFDGHLYWPDLDVDLGVGSLEHPERFPLKAR